MTDADPGVPIDDAIAWLGLQVGNVHLLDRLDDRLGSPVLRALVDGGWVDVRHAEDEERFVNACRCGSDTRLVATWPHAHWACEDAFCLPREASEPRVVWSSPELQRRAFEGLFQRCPWSSVLDELGVRVSLVREHRGVNRVRFTRRHRDLGSVRLETLAVLRDQQIGLSATALSAAHGLPDELILRVHAIGSPLFIAPDGRTIVSRGELNRVRGRSALILRAFTRRPGAWLTHRELQLEAWPDEITTRGRVLCGETVLDRRLRQVIGELRRMLPADVIEKRWARAGTEGAYRLVLGRDARGY